MFHPPDYPAYAARRLIPDLPFEPWMLGTAPAKLWCRSLLEEQQRRAYCVLLSPLQPHVTVESLQRSFGKVLDLSKVDLRIEGSDEKDHWYRRGRLSSLTWNEMEACLDLGEHLKAINIDIFPDPKQGFVPPTKLPEVIPKTILAKTLPLELLTNLYVFDIPEDWSAFQLRDVFSSFGEVEHAEIMNSSRLHRGRTAKWAFIDMSTFAAAIKAVEKLDGMPWAKGHLEVRWADKQRKLTFEILKAGGVTPPQVLLDVRRNALSPDLDRTVILEGVVADLCQSEETVLQVFSLFGRIRYCHIDAADPHVSPRSARRRVTLTYEQKRSSDALLATRDQTDCYIPRAAPNTFVTSRYPGPLGRLSSSFVPTLSSFSSLAPRPSHMFRPALPFSQYATAMPLMNQRPESSRQSSAFFAIPPSAAPLKVHIRAPASKSTFDPFAEEDNAMSMLNRLHIRSSISSRGSSGDSSSFPSRVQPVTPSSTAELNSQLRAQLVQADDTPKALFEQRPTIQHLNAASTPFLPHWAIRSATHPDGRHDSTFARAPGRPLLLERTASDESAAKSIEALQKARENWETPRTLSATELGMISSTADTL